MLYHSENYMMYVTVGNGSAHKERYVCVCVAGGTDMIWTITELGLEVFEEGSCGHLLKQVFPRCYGVGEVGELH